MLPNNTTTKEKIIYLIKRNSQMTVIDLSTQLQITEMAVRRHIQVLENDGFLLAVSKKNALGRPAKVYELTEKGEATFPQNYKQVGLDLLNEINQLDPTIVNKAIRSRHQRLVGRFQPRLYRKEFKIRIEEMVKIQNELGFMAEGILVTDEIAEIKQWNCPYLELAKDFPEVCQNEKKWFEDLLETNNIQKRSSLSKGSGYCLYHIVNMEEA